MAGRLPIATAVFCLVMNAASLEIDTGDGGYKELLIAIHKDVPYNESIVTNLKELLQSSSEFLHRATNGRVYFKHVTIHFPNTWPKRSSARSLSSSSFDKSDVRVRLPQSAEEDRPFTRQSRPCGQQGDFIQIPPSFLAELRASTTAKYINPAYVLVHEWAHYRYGVFDEYGTQGDQEFPLTYCRDGKVRLNSCSREIRFKAIQASGEKCDIDANCQFTGECTVTIFVPKTKMVESSIMFMPYQRDITQFCDSAKGIRMHDQFAPNKQNKLCRQRSTWDVISENDDFKKAPRPDMSKRIRVSIEETQEKEALLQRVVLVFCVSGSMSSERWMEVVKESAERYISGIEDGSRRLAIITCSTQAKVEHTLMPVNVNTRQGFLNTVKNLKASSRTCIGCGLKKALELLTTPDETPEGAMIVLISDSEENESPRIADVKADFVKAKVKVSTIAMGSSADKKLEELAVETKANAFSFEDGQRDTASGMEKAFVASTTSQSDEAVERSTELVDTTTSFKSRATRAFILDEGLGDTVVIVERTTQTSVPIIVWLVDPSGTKCNACSVERKGNRWTISIPNSPKAGLWQLNVQSSSSEDIQVKSQPKDQDDEPIRATCHMDSLNVPNMRAAIILAQVRKGKKIVLNADVTAEVSRPKPHPKVSVKLNDDGFDPDLQANDGTYSGYFANFVGKGRYAVTAHVSGHKNVRLAEPKHGSGSSFMTTTMLTLSTDADPDADLEYSIDDFVIVNTTGEAENATSVATQEVDSFQRVAQGGSFQVTEDIQEAQVPPGDIRDLAVSEIRPGQNETIFVKLTWTWPGAHLTSGNASSIEIRASKDDAKLKTDFEKQIEITTAHVVEGNLDPLPSGARHEVTMSLPKSFATPRADGAVNWRAFLAARVFNSDGLNSTTSNIVPVSYTPPDVTTTVATTTVATTTQGTTTEVTTTEATTTEAATAPPTTAQPTIAQPTTAQPTTSENVTTTEATSATAPSAPPDVVQGRQVSGRFTKLWIWILIGGVTAVIVIAIVVGVLMKMSSKNITVYNCLVGRSQSRERMPA
ncbi:calcium-activated chloride channel regulator 1-like [Amblyomma americanum]